ncbi:MAG: DUF927 domain-containing protein [Blastomonas sp.]|uniref:DUF927 domain-containing protein n=1 Tax=Blastomonas sp. TaxID=1909299 RepID=UPI00258C6991|nr:DUF927 domain-containing protein [Blastomonas sp.]MCO5792677.1 DUF927 domain-containing protein [Blastomonas sp.]
MRNSEITVDGLIGDQDRRYYQIRRENDVVTIPTHAFSGAAKAGYSRLADLGISFPDKKALDAFRAQMADCRFVRGPSIAAHSGWVCGNFVFPSGAIADGEAPTIAIAFETTRTITSKAGKGKTWLKGIPDRLRGQSIPVFALCATFAAPLLELVDPNRNYVFELVGKAGIGKSTIQQLAAANIGVPTRQAGTPCISSFLELVAEPLTMLNRYRDLPLIVDGVAEYLGTATKAQRTRATQILVGHLLTSGTGGVGGASVRTIALLSSNRPILSALGHEVQHDLSLADKVLTIPIADDRPYGVFDTLPDDMDGHRFSTELVNVAQANFGHAMPRFIAELAKAAAADRTKVIGQVNRHLAQFRKKAGVDENNGAEVRVADAFGLVYAAGRLAKTYKVFPKTLNCFVPALACYRLNRMHRSNLVPLADRLPPIEDRIRKLFDDEAIVRVPTKGSPSAKVVEAIARADVLRGACKGSDELWIRPTAIHSVLPDWSERRCSDAVRGILVHNGKKLTTKRRAGPEGKHALMYVFRISTNTPMLFEA